MCIHSSHLCTRLTRHHQHYHHRRPCHLLVVLSHQHAPAVMAAPLDDGGGGDFRMEQDWIIKWIHFHTFQHVSSMRSIFIYLSLSSYIQLHLQSFQFPTFIPRYSLMEPRSIERPGLAIRDHFKLSGCHIPAMRKRRECGLIIYLSRKGDRIKLLGGNRHDLFCSLPKQLATTVTIELKRFN